MAKQPQQPPGAKNNETAGGAPYPKDWGRMDQQKRAAWMRANRPNRNANAPAPAPARAPANAPLPADEEKPPGEGEGEGEGAQYAQEGDGEEGTLTLTFGDLATVNPLELAADILRAVADHICAPGGAANEPE